MDRDIVSAEQQPAPRPLGDRLESAIGETSDGIGVLLSGLVRRSLTTSVSDIGGSLTQFAEEQVEIAVQQQMPEVTEAADAIALSTSKRVVHEALDEWNEKAAEQQRVTEEKIDAAETNAFERSQVHVADLLTGVHESIDQTRNLAVEGNDLSQQKIQELREKARQTWLKLKEAFTTVNDAHDHLRHEHDQLHQKHDQLHREHGDLRREHGQLGELLAQVRALHDQQVEASEQKLGALLRQNQRLEERLAVLEQPRGIKGLIAKFRGGGKGESATARGNIDDPDATLIDEPDR